jgi:hypothetical protein
VLDRAVEWHAVVGDDDDEFFVREDVLVDGITQLRRQLQEG